MMTFGLPTSRQERGSLNDIVFGEDFLALLLESPAQEDLINVEPSITGSPDERSLFLTEGHPVHVRLSRSTLFDGYESSRSKSNDDVTTEPSTLMTTLTTSMTTDNPTLTTSTEQNVKDDVVELKSTDLFSAESNEAVIRTDFRRGMDVESGVEDNKDEYPARVQSVPGPEALPLLGSNTNLYQDLDQVEEKDSLSPYHHQTLIFHDAPHDLEKAKSVSYSSVVHNLPQNTPDQWESRDDNKETNEHGRQERHYNSNSNFGTNFYDNSNGKNVELPTKENHNEDGSFAYTNSNTPLKTTSNGGGWRSLQPQRNVESTSSAPWSSTKPYEQNAKTSRHPQRIYAEPEKNYEIEESVSVLTNGRVHGIQPIPPQKSSTQMDSTTAKSSSTKHNDNQKVGYVVEGRNYRKYRVEERTPDGFIVGEYGVVSHNDGSLRGVRYTADGTINPRLIYDALMKFLSL